MAGYWRAGPSLSSVPGEGGLVCHASCVATAARALTPYVTPTPLLPVPALSDRLKRPVFVKAEGLQALGSFKIRGATHWMVQHLDAARARGVVAWSSGNHAQAVAGAARRFGVRATVVMPADAPAPKRTRTEALGGRLVFYDRVTEDREAIARTLAARDGSLLLPSYDDADVIAGQGTVGNEIAQTLRRHGQRPGAVLVPCGGGGLLAGSGLALRALVPDVALWAVEPEGFDDTGRSLAAGERRAHNRPEQGFCDALLAKRPGKLTFPILQALGVGARTVSEAAVRQAMRFAFAEMRLVLEPGGAVALAALMVGAVPLPPPGQAVVAVLSGGNVAPEAFMKVMQPG